MCLTLTWEERNDSPLWILLASFHREFIQQFHLKHHSFPISMHSFHMHTYKSIKARTTKGGGEFFVSFKSAVLLRNSANKSCQRRWTTTTYGMVFFSLLHMLLAVQSTPDRVEHFCPFNFRGRASCGTARPSLKPALFPHF